MTSPVDNHHVWIMQGLWFPFTWNTLICDKKKNPLWWRQCLCLLKPYGALAAGPAWRFRVIRGVCSILPEGSAAWRINSPTCLCFSDLCCPGNRFPRFAISSFFSFFSIHLTPHHYLHTLHAAAAWLLPPPRPAALYNHVLFKSTAVFSQCHRTAAS